MAGQNHKKVERTTSNRSTSKRKKKTENRFGRQSKRGQMEIRANKKRFVNG